MNEIQQRRYLKIFKFVICTRYLTYPFPITVEQPLRPLIERKNKQFLLQVSPRASYVVKLSIWWVLTTGLISFSQDWLRLLAREMNGEMDGCVCCSLAVLVSVVIETINGEKEQMVQYVKSSCDQSASS